MFYMTKKWYEGFQKVGYQEIVEQVMYSGNTLA